MSRDNERQRRIVQTESAVLHPYIAGRSVCLIIMRDGMPYKVCSGTCVVFAGNYGVATAAHEIKKHPIENISISFSSDMSPVNQFIEYAVYEGGEENDQLDVAFLKLTTEGVEALRRHKEFLAEDKMRLGIAHLGSDRVIVYGTPTDFLDRSRWEEKILGTKPLFYSTVTLPGQPAHFNASIDIALDYPEGGNFNLQSGKAELVPDVDGISGGGIWSVGLDCDGVWNPESARLIGIEISWKRSERWVRGNQIQHFLALKERLP